LLENKCGVVEKLFYVCDIVACDKAISDLIVGWWSWRISAVSFAYEVTYSIIQTGLQIV